MVAKRRIGWRAAMLVLLILIAVGTAFAFANLNPVAARMAEARVRQLAVEALNNAVHDIMASGVRYADLMTVKTDEAGQVTMLQANTLVMNELASRAALAAQHNLQALEEQGVDIPLGAALGMTLFAGAGPRYRVQVMPVGSVTTRFATAFESAGINQTRHEISLEAETRMKIVIPTGASSIVVTAYVPVAESIIVGRVPDTYVNVPDPESALNLIP